MNGDFSLSAPLAFVLGGGLISFAVSIVRATWVPHADIQAALALWFLAYLVGGLWGLAVRRLA